MNEHARIGAEILGRSRSPLFQLGAEGALAHHKRWMGAAMRRTRERARGAPAREGELRVCVWPDDYVISLRNPHTLQLEGLDVDRARELGRELGLWVRFVDAAFVTLLADVLRRRRDVAMFAIGMLPQRVAKLRFTRPDLTSDIYAITLRGSRLVTRWEDIDKPGVSLGVQTGTFMEPVTAERLRHVHLVRIAAPATREAELEAGRIDVFVTDFPNSRRLQDDGSWPERVAPPQPIQVLPDGYAVHPADAAWWAVVDGFVERAQRDGRLRAAARRHGLLPVAVLP